VKHRWLYPKNWKQLAFACKEAAGWVCEFCGIAHGAETISRRTGNVYTVYLHAAHLDHDPWNPNPRLAALCPSCHGRYDWQDYQRKVWLELEVLRHQVYLQACGYGRGGR
jgi:hypothetical protein